MAPGARIASAVAALFVHEHDGDLAVVAIPRPETHLIIRFGSPIPGGLDAWAMGGRQSVRRKVLGAGQRTVTARLRLGAQEAVLGVSAAEMADRLVRLQDLWGHSATQRLFDGLARARDTIDAAAILQTAIAERLQTADALSEESALAFDATRKLLGPDGNVNAVATDLGVSARHLRRLFREAVGVSPKAFARLARFRLAVRTAREGEHATWASIAAAAGYYDQAHLIAEFRAISGVTPRTLLGEIHGSASGVARLRR